MKAEKIDCTFIQRDEDGNVVKEVDASVNYDLGEDLKELTAQFGDETIYHQCRARMIVIIQNVVRTQLKAGKTLDEIQTYLKEKWEMPTGKSRGMSALEKARAVFGKLSPEEREALLAGEDAGN